MSYDLLNIPEGYETDLVLVIAPYFDPKFVTTLVKNLDPCRIRFVIDDGVRSEDLEKLRKSCGKRADVKIALAAAAGLVHIKGYYIEFVKTTGRGRRKRHFFFGSANATQAAFGGRNAELMASVDLFAEEDNALLNYFTDLVAAIEDGTGAKIDAGAYGPLRNSPTIYLPSFEIAAPGPAPGFDAWLQRGLLAAKYREAQQFLIVSIPLKSRLPPGMIARVFQAQGLLPPGGRNVVRFAYVRDATATDLEDAEDTSIPQWKVRYCNWTHLGDWLSDDCFRSQGHTMRSKTAPARETKINELLNHGEESAWKAGRTNAFLTALDSVWKALSDANISPHEYLKDGSGGIDRDHYGKHFGKKLVADFRLAQDRDFRERYIHGYEFPDVPRFRQDTASWDNFIRSWCESVAVEASKKGSRSLLARAIAAVSKKSGVTLADLEPDEVRRWLRDSWGTTVKEAGEQTTIGEIIARYYQG